MNIVCIIIKFQLFEQQNMERVVREYGRNRSTDLEIITGGYRTLRLKNEKDSLVAIFLEMPDKGVYRYPVPQ
jgi:hypothetical protein